MKQTKIVIKSCHGIVINVEELVSGMDEKNNKQQQEI